MKRIIIGVIGFLFIVLICEWFLIFAIRNNRQTRSEQEIINEIGNMYTREGDWEREQYQKGTIGYYDITIGEIGSLQDLYAKKINGEIHILAHNRVVIKVNFVNHGKEAINPEHILNFRCSVQFEEDGKYYDLKKYSYYCDEVKPGDSAEILVEYDIGMENVNMYYRSTTKYHFEVELNTFEYNCFNVISPTVEMYFAGADKTSALSREEAYPDKEDDKIKYAYIADVDKLQGEYFVEIEYITFETKTIDNCRQAVINELDIPLERKKVSADAQLFFEPCYHNCIDIDCSRPIDIEEFFGNINTENPDTVFELKEENDKIVYLKEMYIS